MRSLHTTRKSSPCSPQLEKPRAQQRRPNAAKKNLKNKNQNLKIKNLISGGTPEVCWGSVWYFNAWFENCSSARSPHSPSCSSLDHFQYNSQCDPFLYFRGPQPPGCGPILVRGLLGKRVKLHLPLPIACITTWTIACITAWTMTHITARTILPLPLRGKTGFHEASPWCQKDWGPLLHLNPPNSSPTPIRAYKALHGAHPTPPTYSLPLWPSLLLHFFLFISLQPATAASERHAPVSGPLLFFLLSLERSCFS